MKKLMGTFGVCLALLSTVWADLTIVEKSIEAGEELIAKKYYSNNKYKYESFYEGAVDFVNIMDFSEMTFTEIDMEKKSYCIFDCSKIKHVLNKTLANKGPKVTKVAGKQEIIAGLKADKYLVKLSENPEMEVWMSTSDKIENHSNVMLLEAFDWFYGEIPESWDEFSEDYLSTYGKLKSNGLVLKTVWTDGLDKKVTTVVTSIDNKSIPASTFELPSGFKEVSAEELYGEGTGLKDCIELMKDQYSTQASDMSTPVSTMIKYLEILSSSSSLKALFPLVTKSQLEEAKDISDDHMEFGWAMLSGSFNQSTITDVAFEKKGSTCIVTFKGTSQGDMFSMGDKDETEESSVSIVVNMEQENGSWKVGEISASHKSGEDDKDA
jgi:hypothetical protein